MVILYRYNLRGIYLSGQQVILYLNQGHDTGWCVVSIFYRFIKVIVIIDNWDDCDNWGGGSAHKYSLHTCLVACHQAASPNLRSGTAHTDMAPKGN